MSDEARTEEPGDEDRLPWLEAVEEEDEREGPSLAKLIGAILIGLVAIGLIVGGLFWLGNRGREGGDGELIAAEEGDYKVRPEDRGGMNVTGTDNTSQAASKGDAPAGRIDTGAVPETPVARPPRRPQPPAAPPRPAPQPRPAPPARPSSSAPFRARRRPPAPGTRWPAVSAIWRRSAIRWCRFRAAAAPSIGCAPAAPTPPRSADGCASPARPAPKSARVPGLDA